MSRNCKLLGNTDLLPCQLQHFNFIQVGTDEHFSNAEIVVTIEGLYIHMVIRFTIFQVELFS